MFSTSRPRLTCTAEDSIVTHAKPERAQKRPGVKTIQNTTQTTTQKIVTRILQKPEITRQEPATEVGITDSGIKYHLKKIQDKSLLRRVGPDKVGYWEVVRQNEQ